MGTRLRGALSRMECLRNVSRGTDPSKSNVSTAFPGRWRSGPEAQSLPSGAVPRRQEQPT